MCDLVDSTLAPRFSDLSTQTIKKEIFVVSYQCHPVTTIYTRVLCHSFNFYKCTKHCVASLAMSKVKVRVLRPIQLSMCQSTAPLFINRSIGMPPTLSLSIYSSVLMLAVTLPSLQCLCSILPVHFICPTVAIVLYNSEFSGVTKL